MRIGVSVRGRVLVVEDEADLQLLWGAILGRAGLEVIHAADAQEGLRAARAQRPDLILVDGRLPDMSGWEMAEIVTNDAALSGIPVVMITADASPEAEARGYQAGVFRFLTKPVGIEELLATVRQALG